MPTISLLGSMSAAVLNQKMELYSKNAYILEFTVTENGVDYILTGSQVDWYLAASNDDNPFIHKSLGTGIALSDPTHGEFQVTIAETDLQGMEGNFVFEALVTPLGGTQTTVGAGRLILHRSISDLAVIVIPPGSAVIIDVTNGGTGQGNVPAKGDLLVGGAGIFNLVGVGADGEVLAADAASTYGVKWVTVTGTGDVVGPATSVDNRVPRFHLATGKVLQESLMTIDDNGKPDIPSGQTYDIDGTPHAHTAADVGAAPSAQGVTNGNSHDHNGGDGAQIDHTGLSNIGTNVHSVIDTHLGAASPHSGHAIGIAAVADNVVPRFDDVGGKQLQDSLMTIDNAGSPDIPTGQTYNVDGSQHAHAGEDIISGEIDGDRLPAMSTAKKGGVPATGAPSGMYLDDSGNFSAPAGSGDVTGPAVSIDNQIARFHLITGKVIQQSLPTVDDSGSINIPAGQQYTVNGAQHQHDGADIASGRVALAQLPDGTAAQYLRAAGAGSDPAYATPAFTEMAAGQHTLAQEPRGTLDKFIRAQGAGADPIYDLLAAADIPPLSATILTSDSIDGDRLPAMSITKKGGVPATGAVTGVKYLCDDGSFNAPAGSGNVAGPGVSLVNEIATYADATGNVLLATLPTINVAGSLNIPNAQQFTVGGAQHQHDGADVATGNLALAQMAQGSAGQLLTAQGAGVAPVYQNAVPASGGTGQTAVPSKGDVLVGGSNIFNLLTPVGTNGKVLTANSAAAYGVDWETPVSASAIKSNVDYIIYKVGSTYYAMSGYDGSTLSSGAVFHTVVNAAMSALGSGGHIFVRAGSYTQSGAIAMASNITLELDKQATVTMANTSNCHMVAATSKTNFAIIGGIWDGNKANQTAGMDYQPFLFTSCTKSLMKDMIIHDGAYANAYFESCTNIVVQNIESYNPTEQCLMFAYCSNCTVNDTYLHDAPTKGGIYFYTEDDATVQHVDNNIITNNVVQNTFTSGISISLRGAEDFGNYNVIEGNICIDCGVDGQHPGINIGYTAGAQYNKAMYCTVVGNICYETTGGQCGQGILAQCDYCTISDNVIDNYNGSGISLCGNHNVVSNNVITREGSVSYSGILMWDGDYNIVDGNKIDNITGARGIYVVVHFSAGCNYNHFVNNTFSNIPTYYIDIASAGNTENIIECNQFIGAQTIHDVGSGTIITRNQGIADNISLVKYVANNTQPTLATNGEIVLWEDSDGGPLRYIVVRINGATYKVAVA